MQRRKLLQSAVLGLGGLAVRAPLAHAAIPKMKITRIRCYEPPTPDNERFRQTTNIVTVETDQGITGIGEGGMKDTLELFASMLIGEDPSRIEHIWQVMYRGACSRRPAVNASVPSAPSTWPCGISRARRSA